MLLLIVGLLALCINAVDVQTCYTNDPEQYRLYSTWTAYEDARGKDAVVEETLPGEYREGAAKAALLRQREIEREGERVIQEIEREGTDMYS